GRRRHPQHRVQWVDKNAHGFDRYSQDIPAFPAQWLYGLCRALPGERPLLPPSRNGPYHPLDARVAAPGPHDFAVRCRVFVRTICIALTQQASIATRATLRDDRASSLTAARAGADGGMGRPRRYHGNASPEGVADEQ
ncbi:hypothetical protein KXV54_009251, partial [Aspergillus fumigatus]